MTALRQAAKMALEALENLQGGCTDSDDGTVEAITVWCPEIIDALREALAQPDNADPYKLVYELAARSKTTPEQEPVAWMVHGGEIWNTSVSPYRDERGIPLYTHPAPIPEGWQLVPKEPTESVILAGCEIDLEEETPEHYRAFVAEMYRAMLDATPEYKS